MEKILTITYLWVYKAPNDFITREVGISKVTFVDWFNFCWDICRFTVESTECNIIGGPHSIVEINESKFGKTKYHWGHHVEAKQIFWGIDRHTEYFFSTVEDRSALMLSW